MIATNHPRLALLLLAVSLVLPACATNSPGLYVDDPLAEAAPLARYRSLVSTGHETEARAIEEDMFFNLEDLVEPAASRVAGQPVDFPSPRFLEHSHLVEVYERGRGKDADPAWETFVQSPHHRYMTLAVKWVVDHCGESFQDAIDAPEMPVIDAAIRGYVNGALDLPAARQMLATAAGDLYARLGIDPTDATQREQAIDTGAASLGGYSLLPYVALIASPSVHLPADSVLGDLDDLVQAYAHELFHCLIWDESVGFIEGIGEWLGGQRSRDERFVEEAACQVFGRHVVADLRARGRLAFATRPAAVAASAPSSRPGADSAATRSSPLMAALEIHAALQRLAQLYADPTLDFQAQRVLYARYGYITALPVGLTITVGDSSYAIDPGTTPAAKEEQVDLEGAFEVILRRLPMIEFARIVHDFRHAGEVVALRDWSLTGTAPLTAAEVRRFLAERRAAPPVAAAP